MNNTPPLGTLVIEHVDRLGPNSVVGIDTQFFTIQHILKGIKRIPAGYHLLHYSDSVDDGVSMRYAWWFSISEGEVLTVHWNEEEISISKHDPSRLDVGKIYQYMIDYPEDITRWESLTKHIDFEALEEYLPRITCAITTATPLAEENMVLLDILKSKKQDIEISDQSNEELKYTIIQQHKKRDNVVGDQLTRESLDRSWYLAELFGHDIELVLAELEIAYVHFVVLCNLCSYTQWLNLLALVLASKEYLRECTGFASNFLKTLSIQLETIPPDYVLESLSVHVVDGAELEVILSRLNEVYEGSTTWNSVVTLAQKNLNLRLAAKSILDENQFEVYDLSNHDEDDEDAPAVVL